MSNWRKYVNHGLKSHLEAQIKASSQHKKAYICSKNPANAQLWIAIAGLSKQIFDLNLKFDYLERALRDVAGKKEQVKEEMHSIALKSAGVNSGAVQQAEGLLATKTGVANKDPKKVSGGKSIKKVLSRF